jgi:hypothetical protein
LKGTSPPSDHQLVEWNPKSPPAPLHATRATLKPSTKPSPPSKKVSFSSITPTSSQPTYRRSFANHVSKVTTATNAPNASINLFASNHEHQHPDNDHSTSSIVPTSHCDDDDNDIQPSLNSFITSQTLAATTCDPNPDDDIKAVCCSMHNPSSTDSISLAWNRIMNTLHPDTQPIHQVDIVHAFHHLTYAPPSAPSSSSSSSSHHSSSSLWTSSTSSSTVSTSSHHHYSPAPYSLHHHTIFRLLPFPQKSSCIMIPLHLLPLHPSQ